MKQKLEQLKNWFDSLSPRNRQFVIGVSAMSVVIVVALILAMTSDSRDDEQPPAIGAPAPIDAPADYDDDDDEASSSSRASSLPSSRDRPARGADESEPEKKKEPSKPTPMKPNFSDPYNNTQRGGAADPLPQRMPSESLTWDDRQQPYNNGPEMDARATRASFVLDGVVNNPNPTMEGFDEIANKLQSEANLRPGTSIENAYSMMTYISRDKNTAFSSRANQPAMRATSKPGVYEIRYNVAAAQMAVPAGSSQSTDDLKRKLDQQMDHALSGAAGVPVTFTINMNTGVVSMSPSSWWA